MRAILAVCLFLVGCVTTPPPKHGDKPESAHFYSKCDEDTGDLYVAIVPDGWEEGYVMKVGHCLGGLKIIGGLGPQQQTKVS